MSTDSENFGISRLRELADDLGCFTELDFLFLTDTTPLTVEAWRKRRTGPDWVRIGNRVFYPKQGVKDFLQNRLICSRPDQKAAL